MHMGKDSMGRGKEEGVREGRREGGEDMKAK